MRPLVEVPAALAASSSDSAGPAATGAHGGLKRRSAPITWDPSRQIPCLACINLDRKKNQSYLVIDQPYIRVDCMHMDSILNIQTYACIGFI